MSGWIRTGSTRVLDLINFGQDVQDLIACARLSLRFYSISFR